MHLAASAVHSSFDGRNVRPYIMSNACDEYEDLSRIGIGGFSGSNIEKMMDAFGMDAAAIQQGLTQGSITTPVQFLQAWLPGLVKIITAARKIDEITGVSTVGSWEDEQIVQGVLENTGTAVPYGDYTNVPFSSWNQNFVTRTVVRFEEGLRVGILEEKRAARVRVNSGQEKREASSLALEIQRNAVGFYGYNSGNNNTYGFLNDPNLPSYVTVATGVSTSTLWSRKTFLEIIADIRTAVVALRNQSQDTIDPETTPLTLVLPTDSVDYLTVVSDFGISVRDWMTKTYPKIRVVSAPQLNLANGGANVFYLFADSVNDLSTDDGRTFIQVVPARFQLLGIAKLAKAYEEDYSNATAGIMLKRPYAVVRYTGI